MNITNTYTWNIVEIREEVPNVKTLLLEPQKERPDFKCGQYLTVRFEDIEPSEGKAYSISSSPNDEYVHITVKKMGAFSGRLLSTCVGDSIVTSAPYGFFYPELVEDQDVAFVAGGVGITPCMSIIKTLSLNSYRHNLSLFYSNKTEKDIIFQDMLVSLEKTYDSFHTKYYLTQERNVSDPYCEGRMTGLSIVSALPRPIETDFFVSGSIAFVRDMWHSLRATGIESTRIYTEGFF